MNSHHSNRLQSITELISNLLHEEHSEAWLDLAAPPAWAHSGPSQSGERQRVASQLFKGLEGGCVMLAGALQHQQQSMGQQQQTSDSSNSPHNGQEDFQKITEHVYVAIQSFGVELKQPGASQRLQVTFPSQTSFLGTRWMNWDQRFVLNLQASYVAGEEQTGKWWLHLRQDKCNLGTHQNSLRPNSWPNSSTRWGSHRKGLHVLLVTRPMWRPDVGIPLWSTSNGPSSGIVFWFLLYYYFLSSRPAISARQWNLK